MPLQHLDELLCHLRRRFIRRSLLDLAEKRNRNAMLRMQTGLRQSSCGSCRIAGVVLAPDYIRSRLDRLPLLVRSLARVP